MSQPLKSHPMWVRGLKQEDQTQIGSHHHVAPYVGAWIETTSITKNCDKSAVAPYVGAWIETHILTTL